MARNESWHLFVAPLYLEIKDDKFHKEPQKYVNSLKESIVRDSNFKLKDRKFKINSPNDYNVFHYFFDDARRSIFWFDNKDNKEHGAILFRLNASDAPYNEDNPEPIGEMLLRIFESKKGKTSLVDEIQLELMDIDVTFYQFYVGHVSFLCRYVHPDDGEGEEDNFYKYVLMINDRIRRMYLHWLSKNLQGVANDDLDELINAQVAGKAPYHDIRLSLRKQYSNNNRNSTDVVIEDFKACLNYESLNKKGPNRPILLESVLGPMDNNKLGCSFELLDDNRMFTASYILPEKLDTFLDLKSWGRYDSLNTSERWHRLLTVDSPFKSMITNNQLQRLKTIRNSTYSRWIDSEDIDNTTLFGCTRHSFIMIGSRSNYHFKNIVRINFLHQYSEMSRLVLAQSTAVHRFGKVIYNLSGKLSNTNSEKNNGLNESVFNEVSFFKQTFNDFINRLFFREITSQIQGTELYQLLQTKHEVMTNLEELKDEITQLSNHVEMLQRQNQEKIIHLLTQTTIILGLLTLVIGVFGSNFLAMENGHMIADHKAIWIFGVILTISFLSASLITVFSKIPFAINHLIRKIFKHKSKY
jgi:uncharacterized membrane protein YidH (DUF202 family)